MIHFLTKCSFSLKSLGNPIEYNELNFFILGKKCVCLKTLSQGMVEVKNISHDQQCLHILKHLYFFKPLCVCAHICMYIFIKYTYILIFIFHINFTKQDKYHSHLKGEK